MKPNFSASAIHKLTRYFQDKNVLVTGGSSGIGKSLGCQLAQVGANVMLMARNPQRLAQACAELGRYRQTDRQVFHGLTVDVGDAREVAMVIKQLDPEHPIDILVNNAGVAYTDYLEQLAPEAIEEMVRTNVMGTIYLSRTMIPLFKERGGGQIATVASMSGIINYTGYVVYGATKAALLSFSEGLRHECKPFNIDVSVLLPPDVDTPMLAKERRTMPRRTQKINSQIQPLHPDHVALELLRGLALHKYKIIPGLHSKIVAASLKVLPDNLRHFLLDRF